MGSRRNELEQKWPKKIYRSALFEVERGACDKSVAPELQRRCSAGVLLFCASLRRRQCQYQFVESWPPETRRTCPALGALLGRARAAGSLEWQESGKQHANSSGRAASCPPSPPSPLPHRLLLGPPRSGRGEDGYEMRTVRKASKRQIK